MRIKKSEFGFADFVELSRTIGDETLLKIGYKISSSDWAIINFFYSNHKKFYRNRETLEKAIRRAYHEFNHRLQAEQILEKAGYIYDDEDECSLVENYPPENFSTVDQVGRIIDLACENPELFESPDDIVNNPEELLNLSRCEADELLEELREFVGDKEQGQSGHLKTY